jgi:hypothetical protein
LLQACGDAWQACGGILNIPIMGAFDALQSAAIGTKRLALITMGRMAATEFR